MTRNEIIDAIQTTDGYGDLPEAWRDIIDEALAHIRALSARSPPSPGGEARAAKVEIRKLCGIESPEKVAERMDEFALRRALESGAAQADAGAAYRRAREAGGTGGDGSAPPTTPAPLQWHDWPEDGSAVCRKCGSIPNGSPLCAPSPVSEEGGR